LASGQVVGEYSTSACNLGWSGGTYK